MQTQSSPHPWLGWAFLLVAIGTEILGTSFMAYAARTESYWGYGVMAAALALSYYFLSLAIRTISVGVAYAAWEALGLAGLALIGVYLFGETLLTQEIIGLGLSVVGIACVVSGEADEQAQEQNA
ncbi:MULTISPECIES: DMT family transporter [Chromobacterium]|uniref:Spermidine export protein MdtJ n=2 Tax=Chromobacterium TaxID=535 RepID=A0ABS3GKZ0_9NEIS|nr:MULTISPECIES: multidrug efflux SMR transporter [Chromobacterium]AXT46744.1 QacE family quaternary ammonium compound efflux SMR transporter [Chromobacterium rhizoryzae]MBK0414327.1 multidrug efflux SMR transporter [Chromobacterium haemolyticum]MBO0415706.1 multidrug efflux SMR transporter [Chromobacterium haemolyticum]MBO0498778.1 multidrug efflux SMR transporter [Chromobacterium haemolyticum]MDH0343400.1 multidrug efflux SMR transporter [Chromobacterium haemolyticum]